MTLPSRMRHQELNHEAFQEALDKLQHDANGYEVQTRSEAQLADAESEMERLTKEGIDIRKELGFVTQLETQLAGIRKHLELNDADNAIAKRGLLAQINALRESGVEIRQNQEAKNDGFNRHDQ